MFDQVVGQMEQMTTELLAMINNVNDNLSLKTKF